MPLSGEEGPLPYGYSGSGFGKYKAPRAFLKDEKAEVLKAYGLDTLPASKRPHGDKERRVLASPSVDLYSLFIHTSEGRPRRVNHSRWLIA